MLQAARPRTNAVTTAAYRTLFMNLLTNPVYPDRESAIASVALVRHISLVPKSRSYVAKLPILTLALGLARSLPGSTSPKKKKKRM